MPLMTAESLREMGKKLFVACGSPEDEAALVARELVEASLMGLDSHGVARFAQYAEQARMGLVRPGAAVRVLPVSRSTRTAAPGGCCARRGAPRWWTARGTSASWAQTK